MSEAYLVAALRTPVAPRNGAFRDCEVSDLAAPVIRALLMKAGVAGADIDEVILGNALYAGGNPARLVALAAGLSISTPAMTIDTQCCAGLDAILLAAARIRAGEAHAIVAGGVESYSRSPVRMRRPKSNAAPPVAYSRPPFSPWPDRDPDLLQAAADLAKNRGMRRAAQERFAIESHAKALRANLQDEIVPVNGLERDAFARKLTETVCARMPLVAGDDAYGLTASTTAVEADAAAIALVVSESMLSRFAKHNALKLSAGRRIGIDPAEAALGAQAAARDILAKAGRAPRFVELMESFAPQAMAAIADLDLDPAIVNRGGGALSRGHPIGASGAILAVRLFHEMKDELPGALGLAAIAAAGGLGSAALFERC